MDFIKFKKKVSHRLGKNTDKTYIWQWSWICKIHIFKISYKSEIIKHHSKIMGRYLKHTSQRRHMSGQGVHGKMQLQTMRNHYRRTPEWLKLKTDIIKCQQEMEQL